MKQGESRVQNNEAFSLDIEAIERDAARLNAAGIAMLAAIDSGEIAAADERVNRMTTALKALAETQMKIVTVQLASVVKRIQDLAP